MYDTDGNKHHTCICDNLFNCRKPHQRIYLQEKERSNCFFWHFLRFTWKTKNKFRFSKDLWYSSCTISHFQIISWIVYISTYLPIYLSRKSEWAQLTSSSKKRFLKKLHGIFLWIGFNFLKATEQLRGHSLLFTPLSFQEYLVLISSISEGWKFEPNLEPLCEFEPGIPGLGNQPLNH